MDTKGHLRGEGEKRNGAAMGGGDRLIYAATPEPPTVIWRLLILTRPCKRRPPSA